MALLTHFHFLFRHSKALNDVTCSFVTALQQQPPLKLFLIKFMSCQPIRQSSSLSHSSLLLIEKYLNAESPGLDPAFV